MAKLNPNFSFTGSLGNLSAYSMKGVEGIVVRTKGGATKEKIKESPSFEFTRRLNAEFGGRATASQWIMRALWPQKALADYNMAGPVNSLVKAIQVLDTESAFGQRHIVLTKNPRLLEGFSLNRKNPFDSTLRNPVGAALSREGLSAHIDIPALLPGINFFGPNNYPMYSLQAILGIVPDLFFTANKYKPSADGYILNDYTAAVTDWYPVQQGSPALALDIQLPRVPPDASFSLMLTIGIRYGRMMDASHVQQVKHVGCAKILAMG